jgi:hypothetical protein
MGKYRFDKPSKGRYDNEREAKRLSQSPQDELEAINHVRYSPNKDRAIRKGER